MNDFLEQVWENNTVKSYLIVAGVILFVIVLKKLISRYLAGLLFRLVHKIWKDVDKKSFTSLLIQPLGFFLLILVSIVALYKLNFPDDLNFDLYGYTVKEILHCIGTIILISSFVWLLLRIIDFVALILEKKANLTPDMTDNQLVVFFRDFFKVVIVIIGIMMVLNFAFGFNIGSLITGLSIVGAAIALALRESLENLIASFIIFFDKPFTTGDLVKVHNITGTVEKIGLRSTRIRSEQKTFVSVPNKQMVDSILDNLTLRTQRRVDIKLEIDLKTHSSKLEALLGGVKKILERKEIEDVNAFLGDITGNAFVLQSDYYTIPTTIKEFNSIKEQVNMQILKLLEDLQIEIAGANTDVRVNK
ncbi:MAG: mechanosensitive ion channel [Sphingobacteriales bacterium]|nr:mechanosensitive ion channel [Sphingobacteriales bacterium]